jgi:hypothetical protein
MVTIAQLYQETDQVNVTIDVRVNGVLLTQMESCSWSFAIARVPTATIRLAVQAPAAVTFFADVRIDAGFNGQTTRVFTGKVMHVNPDEEGVTIECQGTAYALDVPYHKVVSTLSNITAQAAITNLLVAALVSSYVVNMPAWTIGTVAVQTLTFQTYSEAINKISEVDGARWMEFPNGQIRVEPLDPVPSITAWRKYFSMRLTGTTEAYPTGVVAADGRPRLRRIRGEQQLRDVKNRCYVRGAVVDQVNADGTVSPIDIEGDAQAASPWVLNPDGSQAYNDELFANELIDTAAKAGTVAGRIVAVKDRLNTRATAVIDGDVELVLGRTVYIGDPDYSGIEANFFLESYITSWTGEDFSTTLTLVGGENAGGAVNISPFALFTYVADLEWVLGTAQALLTLDGRGAVDLDGTIASRVWSSNQVPEIVAGTDEVITLLVDLSVLVTPFNVTYQVTDNDGATDSISLEVNLDASAADVASPALYVAADTYFSASPDTGQTWDDQAVPAGQSCISVGAKPGDGTANGVGLYGTSVTAGGGKVYRTTDFCDTAPTLVLTAPGAIDAFGNSFWQAGLAWCVTRQGVLYRSDDDGLTWTYWDDLRIVFGKANFRANQILTPREGGVWVIGGDGEGRPVMAFDPVLTHAWGQVALGGELLIDILTNPVATDLYVRQWAIGGDNQYAAILLNSATFPTAVYWTDDVLGDGSAWKRAVGLPAKTAGRWMTGDYGATAGQFQFGYDDNVVYLLDIVAGVGTATAAAGAMAATDDPNHGIAIGGILGGIAGAHIVAAEGTVDGTLYKTWDRFTTNPVEAIRPGTGVTAPPAGWNAKMITLSSSGEGNAAGGSATVWVQQSISTNSAATSYPRRTAVRISGSGTWTVKANPASASQFGVSRLSYLGGNFYRIVSSTNDTIGYAEGGQLQRSTDGITWADVGPTPVNTGASWWGCQDVAIDAGGLLYLIMSSAFSTQVGHEPELWSSPDGISWTKEYEETGTAGGRWYNFSTIAPHPTNSSILVIAGHRNVANAITVWHRTAAGGAFTRNSGTSASGTIYPQAVMHTSGRMIIGTGGARSRIFTTDDYGATFTSRFDDGAASDGVWDMLVIGSATFALMDLNSGVTVLKRSTDSGVTWSDFVLESQVGTSKNMVGLAASSATGTLFIAVQSDTTGRVYSVASAASVGTAVLVDETANLDSIFTETGVQPGSIGVTDITVQQ